MQAYYYDRVTLKLCSVDFIDDTQEGRMFARLCCESGTYILGFACPLPGK